MRDKNIAKIMDFASNKTSKKEGVLLTGFDKEHNPVKQVFLEVNSGLSLKIGVDIEKFEYYEKVFREFYSID